MSAGSTVRGLSGSSGRARAAGQPKAAAVPGRRSRRRLTASATVAAYGWYSARCSSRRRPLHARVAGTVNSLVRSRLGSQGWASVSTRGSICIQAVTSHASATMAHQILLKDRLTAG